MKKLNVATAAILFTSAAWANLESEDAQISYKVGTDVGKYLKDSEMNFEKEAFMIGLEDGLAGREMRLTKEQMSAIRGVIQKKQQIAQEKRRAEMMEKMEQQKIENKAAGDQFMAEKKQADGVKATDSGLLYEVISEGSGPKPQSPTDTVVVHYTGMLVDGTQFDSSVERGQPSTFALNNVIKGWTEGVQLMNTGSKYRFYIPPELAYGADARPGSPIGPNSTLIFDIELIEIKAPKDDTEGKKETKDK